MKPISKEENAQDVAEDYQGPPGSLAPLDENYCQAIDNLHRAAKDFTKKWLKAPADSSFEEWFKACDALEIAAVEYARAKAKVGKRNET